MEIEQEAKLQGWVPQEEFKGDVSRWVDAETYVERGKEILPIVKSNNKKLVSEVDALRAEVDQLKSTITTQSQSMEEFKIFHKESTKAQVDKARRDLIAELKEAKADGNIDQEVHLTAELSKFDAAQLAPKEESRKVESKPSPSSPHPEFTAWAQENPWYGLDQVRTGLVDGIAKQLRSEGVNLEGRAFAELATQKMNAILNADKPQRTDKVEGTHTSGHSSETSSGKGYSTLPPEAKAVCEKQAAKFVGEAKMYKTKKDWQDYYASTYYEQG